MEITHHIKDLLFLHDCVIIPGLGGFIANYRSSEVQKYKHVISPPSRAVTFNRQLRTNDGLLVNHIALSEKCTYKEAESKVQSFVHGCNRLLENKEILLFPEIGKLYVNASGNLIFLSQLRKNLLPDSFGLKPVSFDPVIYEPKETKARASVSDEAKGSKNVRRINRTNRKFEVTGLTLSVVFIILISQLIIWDFTPEKIKLQGLHLASRNTVGLHAAEIQSDILKKNRTIGIKENTTSNKLRTGGQPVSQLNSPDETGIGYYVVVGAFQNYSNAVLLMNELQQHSETAIIMKTSNGFHRVAIFASNTRNIAQEKLQYYKSSKNPSSWLFYKEG